MEPPTMAPTMEIHQSDGDAHMPFMAKNATVIVNVPVTEQHTTRQYIRNCKNSLIYPTLLAPPQE